MGPLMFLYVQSISPSAALAEASPLPFIPSLPNGSGCVLLIKTPGTLVLNPFRLQPRVIGMGRINAWEYGSHRDGSSSFQCLGVPDG